MKNKSSVIALILVLAIVAGAVFAIGAFASEEETKTHVEAEIMSAPNGATGIATMTFADGIWDVATLVNELCEEYGFRASLMFNKDLGGKTVAEWNALLAEGNLDPESHSLTHKNFENATLTPEEYAAEIGGSYTFLKDCFPSYDILAFAAPSMSYTSEDLEEVNKYFYAARNGQCVLYIPGNKGQMQSINPSVGTTPGTWMNMYQVRIQPNVEMYSKSNSVDKIIEYLDKCVAEGGWFTSLTHTIGDDGDVTLAQLREILDAMKAYVDDGKLWVASYTEATKYIRERQNSTVSAYEQGGVYYVNVKMADKTEDNLPLSSDVFNMPLTVKVDVPAGWTEVSYKLGNSVERVRTRGNEAGRYAYIQVIPNSGDIAITNATPENDQTVTGTYTQPEGTWRPKEGSGITFAEWTSEESFLKGDEPERTFTTTEISTSNVCLAADATVKSSYVHLFADCTTMTSAQMPTGKNQTIVINLGGHTLDVPKGIRPGDAYGDCAAKLTIKNGTFNHNGGDVQCRGKAELRYDNIVYNVTSGHMNYDGNASLVEFKNSKLNVYGSACFTAGFPSGRMPCQYRFINTDVYMGTGATGYLFRFNAAFHAGQYNHFSVFFDKDSSVIREVDYPLVCINRGYTKDNDVPIYLTVPAEIVFEEGCVLSENIAPVYGKGYSYVVEHYNQSSGQYGPTGSYTSDSRYIVSFDGGFANHDISVKVVRAGTSELISYKGYRFDEGKVVLEKTATTAWVPDDEHVGITYGLWKSEAEYLAGSAPKEWSTSTTFTYEIMGVDNSSGAFIEGDFAPGYMRLYSDLTLNGGKQLVIGDKQSVTIDLNGFTLRDTVGIRPGGSSGTHSGSYTTIKNGIWIHSTGGGTTSQYQMRQDTKVVFDKVLFIQEGGSFHGCAPDLWKFKDSTFYFSTFTTISLGAPYTSYGYRVSEIVFENTDIISRTEPTGPLFMFTEAAYGDCVYNLIFDQNSSINVDYQTYGFVKLIEAFATTIRNTFDVRIIMEDGFTVYGNARPTFDCTYVPIDPATNAAGAAYTLKSSTDEGSKFRWVIAEPDTHTNGKYTYYELDDTALAYNGSRRLIANLGVYYQYVELAPTGEILNTWPLGSALGTDAKGAFVNVNGSTIKFFHDTEVKNPSTYSANDITFDLNGCTLTKTGDSAFQLGYGMSGQWKERVVKFINSNPDKRGVLDFDNMASAIQNRPGSVIVFENIDIWAKTGLFTEYGAKSVTFTNVNFYSTSGAYIIGGGFDVSMVGKYTSDGGVREFVFDNCTFNNVIPISWSHSNVNDNVKVIFRSGTTFANNGYAPINISGDGVKNIEVIIEDGVKIPYLTTSFVRQSGTACAVIKGDKITAFEISDGYYVTSSKPSGIEADDLQANLTLYTDFQLNLFAKDKITKITANGEELESVDYNGLKKYSIRNITPDVAAENIELLVYLTVEDKDYILPISYSILKYSEQVVKSESTDDDAKKLVSAAMDYIKAAYVYTGKTAPDFTGIAYDKYTATATDHNISKIAIKGAQLDLASGFKLRFNITEGYSGKIVVNGVSYEVENGTYNGITYIEVEMRAYALYDTAVAITVEGTTGYYSLANYVKFANEKGGTLSDLANALYNYAAYANSYKYN